MKPETIAQASIVTELRKAGYICIRIQCGKVRVRGGWMQLAEEGTPDLFVVPDDFLETKTATGKLSDAQKRMHRMLRSEGSRVHVVRTPLEALRAVMTMAGPKLRKVSP